MAFLWFCSCTSGLSTCRHLFLYWRRRETDMLTIWLRGTMDHWDPALINPLAARRPVVLIDNSGVGRSQGEVAKTFTGWAKNYIDVIEALGIRRADVMGFSMGGCVAQMVALNAPKLVRSLILCGTVPSTGEGVSRAPIGPFNQLKAAVTAEEHRKAFLDTFFHTSERSQAAGMAAWDRITTARSNRSDYVDAQNSHRQAISFAKFMDPKQANDASYDRFHELQLPVLIANGKSTLILPLSGENDMAQIQ